MGFRNLPQGKWHSFIHYLKHSSQEMFCENIRVVLAIKKLMSLKLESYDSLFLLETSSRLLSMVMSHTQVIT